MKLSRRGLLAGVLGLPLVAAFGRPKDHTAVLYMRPPTFMPGPHYLGAFNDTTAFYATSVIDCRWLDGDMELTSDSTWADVGTPTISGKSHT